MLYLCIIMYIFCTFSPSHFVANCYIFENWNAEINQTETETEMIAYMYYVYLMHWRHKGSHLHNNDASLVSRSAHVLCWQCALALSLSVRGPGRASPAVWLAGFAPLAACLAMTHVAVFRLTPNAAGRPSVTSYAYGLLFTSFL